MFYVPEKISGLYCSDTLVYAVHDIINLGHNRFLPDLDDEVFFGKVTWKWHGYSYFHIEQHAKIIH